MPLYIEKKNGKKIHLNLNNYRNWHYQSSNNFKKQYQEIAYPKIPKIKNKKIAIKFTLFRADNRSCDLSNVCSIHDKFFCDALTKHGFIPDDSCEHVRSVSYLYGGIDKQNGRVEIEIEILQA